MEDLKKQGLIQPAGLAIFEARDPRKIAGAAYERKHVKLASAYIKQFKSHRLAWADFEGRIPSYKKQCIWWVMSAKKKETQLSRLAQLIDCSAKGEKIPPLRWQK